MTLCSMSSLTQFSSILLSILVIASQFHFEETKEMDLKTVVYFSVTLSIGLCGNFNDSFSAFEKCLKKDGADDGNFVKRASNSRQYENLNRQWLLKPPFPRPQAFFVVKKEEEVASAVRCGRNHEIRIVAKGGGHSYQKYSFGDAESVVVDFRKMDKVLVNKNRKSVEVGPGSLVGPTIYKLWQQGRHFLPTGSCPSIGMAGQVLGGGWGLFARKYSVLSDSLVALQVVNAQGQILEVNEKSNSDLFWALRGGLSSFGIITKFTFRLLRAPKQMFSGVLTYPMFELKKPEDLLKVTREVQLPLYDLRKSFYVRKMMGMAEILLLKALLEKTPKDVFVQFGGMQGGAVNDISRNATAFVHRGDVMYHSQATFRTMRVSDVTPQAKQFVEGYFALGELIFGHVEVYQNYPDPELSDYNERYYVENLKRLRIIKRKYDPDNYFQNPQSIPPL